MDIHPYGRKNRTNKMSQVMIFINAYSNLNLFWASLCPSSGEQERDCLGLHVVFACLPVLQANTTCIHKQSRSCSPDDGHNDARNKLRFE
jgi:hypothetical protein